MEIQNHCPGDCSDIRSHSNEFQDQSVIEEVSGSSTAIKTNSFYRAEQFENSGRISSGKVVNFQLSKDEKKELQRQLDELAQRFGEDFNEEGKKAMKAAFKALGCGNYHGAAEIMDGADKITQGSFIRALNTWASEVQYPWRAPLLQQPL